MLITQVNLSLRLEFLWMDDSYESQKVVQAVNLPLKGLIVNFGSLTHGEEVGSAVGLDMRGGAGESVGGVMGGAQYFSIFNIVE